MVDNNEIEQKIQQFWIRLSDSYPIQDAYRIYFYQGIQKFELITCLNRVWRLNSKMVKQNLEITNTRNETWENIILKSIACDF